jgi:microcystin-dependent protein
MAEPFIGEIRPFAFGVIPTGWIACAGQLLQITQYQALASLLGNVYGGDGKVTFGIPDLRGRTPLMYTTNLGTNKQPVYQAGKSGGTETVTLTAAQIPAHTHDFLATTVKSLANQPTSNFYAATSDGTNYYGVLTPSQSVGLHPNSISSIGGGTAHANVQPSLAISFCIATTGYYPPRP